MSCFLCPLQLSSARALPYSFCLSRLPSSSLLPSCPLRSTLSFLRPTLARANFALAVAAEAAAAPKAPKDNDLGVPPAAKRQRGDAASGVNAYARLQVTCCRTEDRLGWEVRAGLARGVEGTPSTLGPVYFWGGPVYFSGGPVYFWGGPVYFWCGPVHFWGGPVYFLGWSCLLLEWSCVHVG